MISKWFQSYFTIFSNLVHNLSKLALEPYKYLAVPHLRCLYFGNTCNIYFKFSRFFNNLV